MISCPVLVNIRQGKTEKEQGICNLVMGEKNKQIFSQKSTIYKHIKFSFLRTIKCKLKKGTNFAK